MAGLHRRRVLERTLPMNERNTSETAADTIDLPPTEPIDISFFLKN
jgi:hypothetical protein